MPTISQLDPADAGAVRQLIVQGLTERWGAYDPALTPDLTYLVEHYGGSVFLVAKQEGKILACGALMPAGERRGAIVRMSVDLQHRRQGLASRILLQLLEHAMELGYVEVVLETTATWDSAIAFYQRHGFALVDERDGNLHFSLSLEGAGH